jgi:hypothetical protein
VRSSFGSFISVTTYLAGEMLTPQGYGVFH